MAMLQGNRPAQALQAAGTTALPAQHDAARSRRSGVVHCSARDPVEPTRRQLLTALWAAPAVATALLAGSLSGSATAAAAQSGPRMLSAAELAAVEQAFAATLPKTKAPVVLRLVFHDAGTFDTAAGDGGANASIRYELDRPESFGLKRGWGVIEQAAAKLRGTAAEGVVSMADLIALGGAYAVRITGGPSIAVPIGRVDAAAADPANRLPEETLSAPQQLAAFAAKGISPPEFVALLGSHTLGNKGFGEPLSFDNEYYASLLRKPWDNKADPMGSMIGLASDHVLPDDPTCRPTIERYAADQGAFFEDFAAAYVKLTTLGARWA